MMDMGDAWCKGVVVKHVTDMYDNIGGDSVNRLQQQFSNRRWTRCVLTELAASVIHR